MDLNPTILIITFNINGLNIPIKRQRLSDWILKATSNYMPAYKKFILNRKIQIGQSTRMLWV